MTSRKNICHRTAIIPARPIRLFERPEPIEADRPGAGRPAGAIQMAARHARSGACRRPRAHRHAMVARRPGPRADARLFPRSKAGRARASGSIAKASIGRRQRAALVPARAVRMSDVLNFPAPSKDPSNAAEPRAVPPLMPNSPSPPISPSCAAPRIRKNWWSRRSARSCRHRHRRPQYGRGRGARPCGGQGAQASSSPSAPASSSPTARPTSSPIRRTAPPGAG